MIALIDGDSIAYIAGSTKKGDEPKTEELAIEQINSIIKETVKNTGATGYLLFLTRGKRSFRYTICPDYKKNRIGLVPPPLMSFCKDYMESLDGVYSMWDIEADDAVNIMKHYYGVEGIICSPDKDVLNLEGKHYNYKKLEFVTTSLSEAKYRFWTDMICGQSGDGIKGIPGRGAAYAKRLFEEHPESYYAGTVLNAYIDAFVGEQEAIEQFNINYNLLKILDFHKDFIVEGFTPKQFTLEELLN